MPNNEMTIEVLNDLVEINNDRIAGYQHAIKETKNLDVDLKSIFEEMIRESQQYKQELIEKIRQVGGAVKEGTTTSGKIYRAWMDVKATITGHDRKSILASCEFGEDAAQHAYETALHSADQMPAEVGTLIKEQKTTLKNAHDLIKKYHDAQKTVDNN